MVSSALLLLLAASAPQQPLPVPPPPPERPAETDPGRLVVLNKAEDTAHVIHLKTGETIARLDTGVGPHEVAVSPSGRWAVVADYGRAQPGRTLTVLDLHALEVARTIDLGAPARPHGIAFEPDGGHLWVTAEQAGALWRVKLADAADTVVTRVDVGAGTVGHMLALAGDRIFVSHIAAGTVTPVVLAQSEGPPPPWVALEPMETGAGAEGIDATPDGREVWVSNRADDTVTVLDARTHETLAELPCAGFPIRLEIGPRGRRAVVSCARAGAIEVFDVAERKSLGRLDFAAAAADDGEGRLFGDRFGDSPVPIGIALHPRKPLAYVSLAGADVVAEVDLNAIKVTRVFATGREPDGNAWAPTPMPDPADAGGAVEPTVPRR